MDLQKRIGIINGILMSGFMAFLLSGFFTWFNLGVTLAWLYAWAKGFAIAWPLAFVLVALVGSTIRKLAVRIATVLFGN